MRLIDAEGTGIWAGRCKGTNADSIRAMNDEELAVWITSIRLDTINEMCKKLDMEIEMPVPTVENTADVCEWLKQPAEGGNNAAD